MDLQDRLATDAVGEVHDDAAVEPTGAEQRAVEDVGLVRGREHDDPLAAGEAVHLGEDLIERLLLLTRAADRKSARSRGRSSPARR